jgi:hypothetical protein
VGIGAFSLDVHGERTVVVGQDHPQAVGGGVFVAAAHLVYLGSVEQVAVLVVGLTQDRYMTRGRVNTQVADLLDRTVAKSGE